MKFGATIWFVVIPYLFYVVKNRKGTAFDVLSKPKTYFGAQTIAWLIRIPVMFGLNIVILKYMGWYNWVTLDWLGVSGATPLVAILVTVIILNTIQSVGDALVPWLIVEKTPLKQFTVWKTEITEE